MKIQEKLLAFQKAGITVWKDANNPAFKSKYASLSNVLEMIVPKLTELKLVVTHSLSQSESTYSITTEITDTESGESVKSSFPVHGSKPQEIGSSITYARRYNLTALLNLDIDDDDDGNAANEAKKVSSKEQEKPWFNNHNLEAFRKVAGNYANANEALKAIRERYAVSTEMQRIVREMYD